MLDWQTVWAIVNIAAGFIIIALDRTYYLESLRKCLLQRGMLLGILLVPVIVLAFLMLTSIVGVPSGAGNPFVSTIPMTVATLILLPFFATGETMLFQQWPIDKWGWRGAVVSSLAFGAVHGILFTSFQSAIMLSLVGFAYSIAYKLKGFDFVASMHFSYDLVLVSLLLVIQLASL